MSYVMPVLNEELYLEDAVASVFSQSYDGEQELVLAVGPGSDRSLDIARALAAKDPRIRIVENPKIDIPVGLNLAIEASRHPIIIRVDAHSELMEGYASQAVATLRTEGAANVGGIMRAAGKSRVQRAIARAYNSPFGLGGGRYHGSGVAGPAESAYLGVFRRDALELVGGFDEQIRRGEDWELNLRIRQSGGIVWLDPRLHVTYWPRASYTALAQQFFATGAWRAVLVRRYPALHPWRFFAPGVLVIGLAVALVYGILDLSGVMSSATPWLRLVYLVPIMYVGGVLLGVVRMPARRSFGDAVLDALALVTMHITWGTGFLLGLLRGASNTVDRSRASVPSDGSGIDPEI